MDEKFINLLNDINPEIISHSDSNLVDDGIIDSLNIMQIVSGFEKNYGIDFDPDDMIPENFSSANAIWQLLQKYLNSKH